MNPITVIASASSRLQADVMLIRLRRAEIDCRKVSVLFPAHSMPNTVGCWLPVTRTSHLAEPLACAGRLRKPAVAAVESPNDRELLDLLVRAGVERVDAHILTERFEQGHILLCVHATSEEEASIAWHVFRHCSADTLVLGTGAALDEAPETEEIQKLAPWVSVAA